MIKDLFLIRHAESSHPFGTKDFDRPLNDKGYQEANKISSILAKYSSLPELLISSPAERALATAKIFAKKLQIPESQIQTKIIIYDASATLLLPVINQLPEKYNRIALFGHNPGITELAGYLSGTYVKNIPTAGIIHIKFSTNWKMISLGTGKIKWQSSH